MKNFESYYKFQMDAGAPFWGLNSIVNRTNNLHVPIFDWDGFTLKEITQINKIVMKKLGLGDCYYSRSSYRYKHWHVYYLCDIVSAKKLEKIYNTIILTIMGMGKDPEGIKKHMKYFKEYGYSTIRVSKKRGYSPIFKGILVKSDIEKPLVNKYYFALINTLKIEGENGLYNNT